ncbi:hypothetical protein GXB82_11440 [Pseudomonas stutzeri]|nr:hypothetical protein [Stutzerimonas stutzeri]
MNDLSYMWILVKPASGLTPTLLLEAWEPVSIDVQEMAEPGTYSVLFSTRKLTYLNTLEGLNEFVATYRRGMKHHQLTEA